MFKFQNFKVSKLQKGGFTLIELMVAMSLFVILMAIAAGGFVNSLKNQRLAAALMTISDNMSLTIEQMAREIRTGYNFSKISNTEIQFVNASNRVVWYRLNNNAIEKGIESGIIGIERTYKKITADNVKIADFNIEICGKNLDSNIVLDSCGNGGTSFSPRITLLFSITSAEPDIEKLNIFMNIQTTVSSRVLSAGN